MTLFDADTDCITTPTVLEVTWTNCPEDVREEVRKFWRNYEAGNDYYYIPFEVEEREEDYPIIAAFLKSKDIEECLIHYWW